MEARLDNALIVIAIYIGMVKDFIKFYPDTAFIALFLAFDLADVSYLAVNHSEGPALSIAFVVTLFLSVILIFVRSSRPEPVGVPAIQSTKDDDWFTSREI